MHKKVLLPFALCLILGIFSPSVSFAISAETEMILDLLLAKGIISTEESNEIRGSLAQASSEDSSGNQPDQQTGSHDDSEHRHSVQSLDQRTQKIEDALDRQAEIAGKIQLSGFVEVELSAENNQDSQGNDESTSDLTLAAAELDVDVNITDNVLGHVAFLYEDGEDLTIDEGIIAITGNENFPLYISVGKMYIPFGWYESHFVSDPTTLVLGETNEGALLLGYANDRFDVNLGAFNAEIDKTGKDDVINGFVASAAYTMSAADTFSLTTGISYTSNLAASDSLQDVSSGEGVSTTEIIDLVGGLGTYIHATIKERFFIYAEYVGALESFTAGDLAFDGGKSLQPRAWNFELAYAVNPQLEIAGRYGGSNEYGSIVAEDQYGIAALFSPFDNTTITGEYLYAEFADNSNSDSATVQLAIEF